MTLRAHSRLSLSDITMTGTSAAAALRISGSIEDDLSVFEKNTRASGDCARDSTALFHSRIDSKERMSCLGYEISRHLTRQSRTNLRLWITTIACLPLSSDVSPSMYPRRAHLGC